MVEKIVGEHQVAGAHVSVGGYQALLANHGIIDKHTTAGMLGCVGIQCDQGMHIVGDGLADQPVWSSGRQKVFSHGRGASSV